MVSDPASEPQNIFDGFMTALNPDLVPISLIRQVLTMIDTTTAVSGYSGFQLATGPGLFVGTGVCNRTPQVRDTIVAAINDMTMFSNGYVP